MRKFLIILLSIVTLGLKSQNILHTDEPDWRVDNVETDYSAKVTTAGCGTPFLTTGYPAWTNYWAGWMINIINVNSCSITVNAFEARFQGTAGYRIYTKTGSYVGFELVPGAWTLVGNVAALTGTSTTAPTNIPIAVNVTIPPGGTQGFYLTRSDNLVANRHLYNTGAGTAGVTVYATDGNLSITEGNYVDPYFAALQIGVRRPSMDVCYTIVCLLPIELTSFKGESNSNYNDLTWVTATEINNDFFTLERSINGFDWVSVSTIDGAGNSNISNLYSYKDFSFNKNTYNYYRLKQTDNNGQFKYSDIIVINNTSMDNKKIIRVVDILGQPVNEDYKGMVIEIYEDGKTIKKIRE